MENTAAHEQRPWLGLDAFTEDLSQFFCGRLGEADELFRRVQRETLTVLFGTSGLGKTSLLRAGLFPALRAEGFLPVYIRLDHDADAPPVGDQLKQAIFEAIRRAGFGETLPFQPGQTLWEFFHRDALRLRTWNDRPVTLVLVLDQFEELFTIGSRSPRARDEHEAFFTELSDLTENRPPVSVRLALRSEPSRVAGLDFGPAPVRVVLSLREDYLANLEGLSGLMPSLARSRMRLTPMDGNQALEAVARPGAGLVTEPVARQIVEFVAAAGADRGDGQHLAATAFRDLRIEPALLSLFCRELNEQRLAQQLPQITAELIEHAGEGILQGYYSSCFIGLSPGARSFVEEELLTSEGHRDDMELHRAREAIGRQGATPECLDTLIDRRLLHLTRRGDAQRVELTHDLLTGVASASRASRHLLEAQQAARQKQQDEADKLRRGKAEAEKRLAEQRQRARWIGAAALVILGVAVVAVLQTISAEKAKNEAQASRDAAQESESLAQAARTDLHTVKNAWLGLREAGQHFDTALLLATSAYRQLPTWETRSALFSSVLSAPNLVAMLRGHRAANVLALAYSQDYRLLASGDNLGTIILWHVDSRLMATPPVAVSAAGVLGLGFDTSGQHLIAVSLDGTIHRVDVRTGVIEELAQTGRTVRSVSFSADRSTVAVGCDDGTAGCWDVATGEEKLPLTPHPDCSSEGDCPTYAVALNRDGSMLLAGGMDEHLFAWNVPSGTEAWRVALSERERPVFALAFDAWDTSFAVGSNSGSVSQWRTPRTPAESTAPTASASASSAAVKSDASRDEGLAAQRLWTSGAQHQTAVFDVRFRDDGHYIGSASLDRVCLWDVAASESDPSGGSGSIPPARAMDGYADAFSIAFRPRSTDFVTGHGDGVIVVWNSELAPRIAQPLDAVSGECSDLAFAGVDSALLAVACGKDLVVLDGATLEYRRTIRVGWWNVVAVAGHPTRPLVACADKDNLITLWDISTGQALGEPVWGGNGSSPRFAFSQDGQTLASSNSDGNILLWSVLPSAPAEIVDSLEGHGAQVQCLTFGPHGLLASGTSDNLVHVWNVDARQELGTALVGHVDPIYSLAFSPDGSRLASGGLRNGLMVWDLARLGERRELLPGGIAGTIAAVAWSRDGQTVFSADWKGPVSAWNLATGEPPVNVLAFGSSVTRLVVQPGGRRVACIDGNEVRLVDRASAAEPLVFRPSLEKPAEVTVSHDGQTIAVSGSGNISAWSADDTARAQPPIPSEDALILFAPDDKTMVIAGSSGEREILKVWDMARHEVVHRGSFPDYIQAIALDGNGRTLAVAGRDGNITLCDWPSLKPRAPPLHRTAAARSIEFSPDGLQLLVCDYTNEVDLYDIRTPSTPRTVPGNFCAATFHPMNLKLALASLRGPVSIYDASTLELDCELQGPHVQAAKLAFSPDGKFLVASHAGSDDPQDSLDVRLARNSIVVWDMDARRAMDAPLKLHQSHVVDLVFSPKGKALFSADADGHVLRWDFDVEHWLKQAAIIPRREFTEREAETYFPSERPPPIEDATTLLDRADMAALRGDSDAKALFTRALAAARKDADGGEANSIAWLASLDGFPDVGLEAAEFAITRAPREQLAMYRDTRGVARALLKVLPGAIEEFEAFVAWVDNRPGDSRSGEFRALAGKRREWIAQLKRGEDPFDDPELLLELRDE